MRNKTYLTSELCIQFLFKAETKLGSEEGLFDI